MATRLLLGVGERGGLISSPRNLERERERDLRATRLRRLTCPLPRLWDIECEWPRDIACARVRGRDTDLPVCALPAGSWASTVATIEDTSPGVRSGCGGD